MDTIISSKIVITRKEHRCEGCARKLPIMTKKKKSVYMNVWSVDLVKLYYFIH